MLRISSSKTIPLLFALCFAATYSAVAEPKDAIGLSDPTFAGKLDNLATGEWWKKEKVDAKMNYGLPKFKSMIVPRNEVIAFGLYTLHHKTLKLTAQLYPLYPDESRHLQLEIQKEGEWVEIQKATINPIGWTATFRVENWEDTKNQPYRIRHGESASYEGTIRKNPVDKDEITVALLSCNSSRVRAKSGKFTRTYTREHLVRNINHQDPDLICFTGDQHYDHYEHTAGWLMFGMQFRETFRHRPCVTIPDDHDVGHGNLWGVAGKKSNKGSGDDGGYFLSAEYVNMVQRAQTAHLPDPYDPTPIQQNISVYYSMYDLGGVSFAIIEDRKFKSAPLKRPLKKKERIDMIEDLDLTPESLDSPDLKLLGDRQLSFLKDWANKKKGTPLKAVISQSPFCNAVHVYGKKDGKRYRADLDSNGWPQTGRNRALRAMQQANAVHLCGDQHLATLIQHGIDKHGDGPWSFASPAIINQIYKRWWSPVGGETKQIAGNPLTHTGDFLDGLNNNITMHAYANPGEFPSLEGAAIPGEYPNLRNAEGHGLIRFNKRNSTITFECWPRLVDVTKPDPKQYPGWPLTIQLSRSGTKIIK